MDFDAFSRNQFNYKSSSKDVRNLLRELIEEQVDGVILDLRGNSGGSLYEAYSLAKLFIGKGSIVQVMESNGSIQPLGHTNPEAVNLHMFQCEYFPCNPWGQPAPRQPTPPDPPPPDPASNHWWSSAELSHSEWH